LHIDKPNEQILLTVPHSSSCDSRGRPLPEIPRLEWSQQHALSETHILLIDPALKKHHAPTVHNAIPHPCDKAQESCTSSDPHSTCNPTSHNISHPPLPNNPNPLPPVNVRPHTDNLALTPERPALPQTLPVAQKAQSGTLTSGISPPQTCFSFCCSDGQRIGVALGPRCFRVCE
jgi:hypothetical protein